MADRLGDAMTWLSAQMASQNAVAVLYRRGVQDADLVATPSSMLLRVSDGDGGTRVTRTERDYAFLASDLVLDGVTAEPQEGDLVEETVGDLVLTYEVLAPAPEEQCWRWLDAHRTRLKVHTKFVRQRYL